MNIVIKNGRLMQILIFTATIICSQNSFCNSNSTTKETTIKISYPYPSVKTITFEEAGDQKITIENSLKKDIEVGNIFFIGDEFTAPLIANDISTHGYNRCSTIQSGTSCSFIINAAKNASTTTTINPNGEQLLISYKISGEKNIQSAAPFKIKIDYNNYITFKVRNLEFTPKVIPPPTDQQGINNPYNQNKSSTANYENFYKKIFPQQKLNITNNNPSLLVNITNIQLTRNDAKIEAEDFSSCTNLSNNGSCEVNITPSPNSQDGIIPIHVTYDLIDGNNMVVNKDLIAVAAAIIDSHKSEPKTQPILAAIVGARTAAFILFGGTPAFKNVFGMTLEASVTGRLLSEEDNLEKLEDYDNSSLKNAALNALAMHFTLALKSCLASEQRFLPCMLIRISTGTVSSIVIKVLTDLLQPNTIPGRLPESNESINILGLNWIQLSLAAIAREGVRCFFIPEQSGLDVIAEIYKDGLTGVYLDVDADRNKNDETLQPKFSRVYNIFPDFDDCVSKECICSNLNLLVNTTSTN